VWDPPGGGDDDEDDGRAVGIVEERPPLREGKIFVDFDDRATIAESLEADFVALDHAFGGIWIEKAWSRAGSASTGTTATSTSWSR
jgi:hypothetical protein